MNEKSSQMVKDEGSYPCPECRENAILLIKDSFTGYWHCFNCGYEEENGYLMLLRLVDEIE